MFRKLLEDTLGELMQEMAPTRPTIDPPDQRRRPDMTQGPAAGGQRTAVGQPRPVAPTDLEGRRAPREAPLEEGRYAPREVPINLEGRAAAREIVDRIEGRAPKQRTNLRTTIAEGAPMQIQRRRQAGFRRQLNNPVAIRNAFRVMEVLRPPVALRELGESEPGR